MAPLARRFSSSGAKCWYTCLRVPVPEGTRAQGVQAYQHFAPTLEKRRAKGAIALRNPRRTYQVTGGLLALSLPAIIASAIMMAIASNQEEYAGMTAGVLMLGGLAVAIPSALIGGMTFLLRWKEAKDRQGSADLRMRRRSDA
jgi:hypothetical protein